MSRIASLEAPFTPALAERFARLLPPTMAPPVLFRAVARNAGLFDFLVDSRLIGPTGLLDRRWLDTRVARGRDPARVRRRGNDYEWRLHVGTISARMGLSTRPDRRHTPRCAHARLVAGCTARGDGAGRCAGARRAGVDDELFARLRTCFDDAATDRADAAHRPVHRRGDDGRAGATGSRRLRSAAASLEQKCEASR